MKKDYNSFVQNVAKELEKMLGDSHAVHCQEIKKNNRVTYQTVAISDHVHTVSPCYRMEDYYELYEKPEDIKNIAKDILKIYSQETAPDFPMGWIHDKDEALGSVMFRIVSRDSNTGLLRNVPHHDIPKLNLSMLFYFPLESSNGEHAAALICNWHMGMWETSEAELLKYAWKNTSLIMGHTINSMAKLLNRYTGLPATEKFPERLQSMYVITNKQNLYGAGCILYSYVLENVAQRLGSDFYILPSSVHETIAVPAGSLDINHAKGLKSIVSEINQSELKPEDVLSNNVYYYCREKHTLSLAI